MIKDVTVLKYREVDDYECVNCKNTAHSSGFEPCLMDGTVVEPLLHGPWQGLYKCMDCTAIHMILETYNEDDEVFLHIKHEGGDEVVDTLQSVLMYNEDSLTESEKTQLNFLGMGEFMNFGGGAASYSTVMRVWPDEESRDEHLRLPSLRRKASETLSEIERIERKTDVMFRLRSSIV